MPPMVTVQVRGLKDYHKKLKKFDVDIRKKIIRTPLRNAMKPIKRQLEINAAAINDTGGLAKTVKLSVRTSKLSKIKGRANRKAIGIASVGVGRSRKVQGETGHQALQIEFGVKGKGGQPLLRHAVKGRERQALSILSIDLGKAIKRWTKRQRVR